MISSAERHPGFEAENGSPGMARMLKNLRKYNQF